jgi:membrane protein
LKAKLKVFGKILKVASKEWFAKDPFKESAVIAYYSIFSLRGLLVVIITIAGYFYGKEAVNGQIAGQISSTMGKATALQIQEIIAKGSESKNSVWASIIGIFTILLCATGVFVQFQKSLNAIWKVEVDTTKSGLVVFFKARLFSFGLILSIAFILIASLVISSLISAIGNFVSTYFSESFLVFIQILNSIISLGILTTLFALMFKFFPDAKVKWKHVWLGSLITAILFEFGKFAIGFYFGTANPGSGYGAAGSIILILLWVSYSSMIVFFGAEFTASYAIEFSGKVAPTNIAHKTE